MFGIRSKKDDFNHDLGLWRKQVAESQRRIWPGSPASADYDPNDIFFVEMNGVEVRGSKALVEFLAGAGVRFDIDQMDDTGPVGCIIRFDNSGRYVAGEARPNFDKAVSLLKGLGVACRTFTSEDLCTLEVPGREIVAKIIPFVNGRRL